MGTNSPLGRHQRVNGNSRLTCNTTIYPEFVTVKFQHLTICRSRLYPEDTPISLIQDQIGLILGGFWAIVQANIVWRSSSFSTISSCSHAFAMKIPVFTETGRIQILHFSVQLWPLVTSWRWTKLKKVNIVAKNVSIVLSNQSNSRSYLLSSVNEKYNYLLLYWAVFSRKMGVGSKIRKSEPKLPPLFQMACIKG